MRACVVGGLQGLLRRQKRIGLPVTGVSPEASSKDRAMRPALRAYALVLGHGLDAEPPHKLFEILSGEWLAQVGPALPFFGQNQIGRESCRAIVCQNV